MKTELNICAKLLELFRVSTNVTPADIENLKIHKSQSYALGPVYAFDYKDNHYYVVDDYSLNDDPERVKDILLGVNHMLKGKILKNTTLQSDGAKYAEGLGGVEYCLWEVPSR